MNLVGTWATSRTGLGEPLPSPVTGNDEGEESSSVTDTNALTSAKTGGGVRRKKNLSVTTPESPTITD